MAETTKTTLTDRLKKIRESLGLSQREMAEAVDSSFTSWQGYEAGRNTPGGKVLESLANMGFNINWLLTGIGEMHGGIIWSPSIDSQWCVNERFPLIRGSMSIKEFASILGAEQWYIEMIENNESQADGYLLSKICSEFDINPAWLLTGEGEMKRGEITKELEDKFFQIPFRDALQVDVTQALIELSSPGIDEEIARKYAALCLEAMSLLGQGREAVPPISYTRRIVKLVSLLYDFYESENEDADLGAITSRVTKLIEKIATKGKSKTLTNEEERIKILELVDKLEKEEEGE